MERITKGVSRAIERDIRRTMRREEKSRKEEKRSLALHKGLTKEVQVKTYTRKTKGGKTVTVKAHTATRKAKQTPSSWAKHIPGGANINQKYIDKGLDESAESTTELIDALTEGTLGYKKGKSPTDTLVNAICALCTPKKGKFGFSDSLESPIKKLLTETLSHSPRELHPIYRQTIYDKVHKKLGKSLSKAPRSVVAELTKHAESPRMRPRYITLTDVGYMTGGNKRLKSGLDNLSPKRLELEQQHYLKKY